MTPAPSQLTREFSMAARYRRCGWYVFLGMLALLGIAATLRVNGPLALADPNWPSFFAGSSFVIAAAVGLLVVVHRWRLRIDERGIARRRFRTWDLWPWEEFRTGQVQGSRNGFTSAQRPAWRNSIALSLLDEDDHEFVLAVCKASYRPAEHAVPILERELVLRYQVFSKIAFRAEGISGSNKYGEFSFPWSEVKEVRLVYVEHWSRQIRGIELDLPESTLAIAAISGVSGPGIQREGALNSRAIQIIDAFLTHCVPAGKLARHAVHGPPQSLAECERRIGNVERELHKATWPYRLVPAACLAAMLGCFGPKLFAAWQAPAVFPNRGWLVLLTLMTISTVLSIPVAYWGAAREICRRHAKSLQELQTWKREHER
jgi:hypothetical protein